MIERKWTPSQESQIIQLMQLIEIDRRATPPKSDDWIRSAFRLAGYADGAIAEAFRRAG